MVEPHSVSFWTYLAVAAVVLVFLNVLFVALMAMSNSPERDYDESRSKP